MHVPEEQREALRKAGEIRRAEQTKAKEKRILENNQSKAGGCRN